MFWFRKKEVTLDCFTTDEFAFEHAPVARASEHYPEWWNNLEKNFSSSLVSSNTSFPMPTMKSCRGFTEYYKNSFVIPFWGNLKITAADIQTKTWRWDSNFTYGGNVDRYPQYEHALETHSNEQMRGFVGDNYQHIKLLSPWWMKTNRYIEFMMTDPIWNRRELTDYSILPGIVDYKYQSGSHINLMFEYRQLPRSINFKACEPIALLTPLTEENVEMKNHLVSSKELSRILSYQKVYFNKMNPLNQKYSTIKKFVDEEDQKKDKKTKCPFGFGK